MSHPSSFQQQVTGWGSADLHMHTTVSDGLASARELLEDVAARITAGHLKLDVLAITDHDRLEASLWACAHSERYPFEVVPGVEVSSAEGHVLALWVTQPIPKGLSLAETTAAIHEQDGIAILAHPFHVQMHLILRSARRYAPNPHYLIEAGIDGIEVHNAGVMLPLCNRAARHFACHAGLAQTGGSDAHTLDAIGTGVTHFPGRTAADLRTALAAQQTLGTGRIWPASAYKTFIHDLIVNHGKRSGRDLPFEHLIPFNPFDLDQDDWEPFEAGR